MLILFLFKRYSEHYLNQSSVILASVSTKMLILSDWYRIELKIGIDHTALRYIHQILVYTTV